MLCPLAVHLIELKTVSKLLSLLELPKFGVPQLPEAIWFSAQIVTLFLVFPFGAVDDVKLLNVTSPTVVEAPPKFAECVKVPTKSPPSPGSPPVKVATEAKLSASSYSLWLPRSPLIVMFPVPALIIKFRLTPDDLREEPKDISLLLEVKVASALIRTSPV